MTPEEELRQAVGDVEFETRLTTKLKDYHQLITREAAAYLLALECFGPRLKVETLRVAGLAARPCLVRVRVERVFEARVFDRGGQKSRTQRLAVTDQSGPGTLVLYDAACDMVEQEVVCGDLIEAGPMRMRGDEFSMMVGGNLRRVQKGPREKISGTHPSIGHFEGVVMEFLGDMPFRKNNWKQKTLTDAGANSHPAEPEMGLMSSFVLKDASGQARVILWESAGLKNALKPGMQAEIENGQRRGSEIHIGSAGRLVFARKKQEEEELQKRPKIERIEIMDDAGGAAIVRVFAGAHVVSFPSLEEACARFGAGPVPEGISAATVLELKKNEWIGKPMPANWEKKE